jgi:hypothetical protein
MDFALGMASRGRLLTLLWFCTMVLSVSRGDCLTPCMPWMMQTVSSTWCEIVACLPPLRSLLRNTTHRASPGKDAMHIEHEKRLGRDRSARAAMARCQHRAWLREKRRQRRLHQRLVSEALPGNKKERTAAAGAHEVEERPGSSVTTTKYWHMVSFYKLVDTLPVAPYVLAEQLRREWEPMGILGRVYVAWEGVNAQLAVPDAMLADFEKNLDNIEFLRAVFLNFDVAIPAAAAAAEGRERSVLSVSEEAHLEVERATNPGASTSPVDGIRDGGQIESPARSPPPGAFKPANTPFPKLSIKVRPQVLADGLSATRLDNEHARRKQAQAPNEAPQPPHDPGTAINWGNNGRKLSPGEFHERLNVIMAGRGGDQDGGDTSSDSGEGGGWGSDSGEGGGWEAGASAGPILLDIRNKYESDVGRFEVRTRVGVCVQGIGGWGVGCCVRV